MSTHGSRATQVEPPRVELRASREQDVGAAASFLVRNISLNAGRLAPGIQDVVFARLHTPQFGTSLDNVDEWFTRHGDDLSHLGYRLARRRVAFRTQAICDWVGRGFGYRGALLLTDHERLFPESVTARSGDSHAVALTAKSESSARKSSSPVVMLDPWPGGSQKPQPVPETLELAHRFGKYRALVFYWLGWA